MRKSQKQDDPEREARYPAWPPRVLLEVKLIPPGNPDDLEKAQWLWVNRPKPDRWDGRILEAVIALLASLSLSPWLGPSLAAWLAKWSLLCAAFFFWRQAREMKRWDRWKADYCRALDRLKVPEA
jgi:hypothetical protein